MKEIGIETLVTLRHFSAPQWNQDQGAWTNKATIGKWLRFAERIVVTLGDLVDEYCTINVPNIFVNDTYMEKKYPADPPLRKDDGLVVPYDVLQRND